MWREEENNNNSHNDNRVSAVKFLPECTTFYGEGADVERRRK